MPDHQNSTSHVLAAGGVSHGGVGTTHGQSFIHVQGCWFWAWKEQPRIKASYDIKLEAITMWPCWFVVQNSTLYAIRSDIASIEYIRVLA